MAQINEKAVQRYKITITKIDRVVKGESEYKKVADTGNKQDGGPVYDYVWREVEKEVETNVLTQEVDDLDLRDVIKAINNLA